MRASQGLKTERLNHARYLLQRFHHLPDAVARMVRDSALSPRQAYRYLQQARGLKQPLPVSDPKVAFTVKLSRQLVKQIRTGAQDAGLSLSEFVSRALSALLRRRRGRG
jgi:predicted HicB family RNase H-like nuclease